MVKVVKGHVKEILDFREQKIKHVHIFLKKKLWLKCYNNSFLMLMTEIFQNEI